MSEKQFLMGHASINGIEKTPDCTKNTFCGKMLPMNILLTSAGRRTYMVDYFKQALHGTGLVFAANSQMSPALSRADGFFLTPIIYSEEYIPFLLEKCRQERISLIVSLFDIDLPVLAKHRGLFEEAGVRLALSDPEMLEICSDKKEMGEVLNAAGIRTPRTFTSPEDALAAVGQGSVSWPLFVKPRFGMGSIGVLRAEDRTELLGAFSICRRAVTDSYLKYESEAAPDEAVLIQEFAGGTEYGLDLICDLDGNYVNTIIRRKCAMRSGETDEAVILGEEDPGYWDLMLTGQRLADCLKPRGLIDVDVLYRAEDPGNGHGPDRSQNSGGPDLAEDPCVIDINARFGGGYPFSHLAGADVPGAYVLWAQGRKAEGDVLCRAVPGIHGYKDITPCRYPQAES